jgi:DNA repair exonuclease SbcCD nuclease subunit
MPPLLSEGADASAGALGRPGSNLDNGRVKIRFFSDTHLGFDYPIKPRIERRRRGEDFFNNFYRILNSSAAAGIDLLIHGGDLFFRSRVPARIVDLTYNALFEFADRGIPIVIVPGNHERSKLPDSLYLSHPNIHVFVKPMTFLFRVRNVQLNVSGFPFERQSIKSRFPKILERTGWRETRGNIKLLCIHQAVEGAQVGPVNFTFRSGPDVIRFNDLPEGFQAILAGHVHRQQILTGRRRSEPNNRRVIYSGSTERTSFAEKDEDKGYFDITFDRTNGNRWGIGSFKFKRLPARPMTDIVVDRQLAVGRLEEFLKEQIPQLHRDSIVRIKGNGKPVNPELKHKLTASFLRGLFPDTMNVELSADFRPPRKRNKKNDPGPQA